MGQSTLTLFVFAQFAVRTNTADIGLHRGPEVVAGQRGKNFGVRDVLEVVVVLANESVAKGWWDEDTGREIGVLVDGKAVAGSKGGGVQGGEKRVVGVLGVFPFDDGSGQVGVERVGEYFEERSGTVQDLSVDAVEVLEVGDVADDPYLVAVQEHDFACTFIGIGEIRLAIELVGVGDAWSQIRR